MEEEEEEEEEERTTKRKKTATRKSDSAWKKENINISPLWCWFPRILNSELALKESTLLLVPPAIAIRTHLRLGGGFVARQRSCSSRQCERTRSGSGSLARDSARGRRCRLRRGMHRGDCERKGVQRKGGSLPARWSQALEKRRNGKERVLKIEQTFSFEPQRIPEGSSVVDSHRASTICWSHSRSFDRPALSKPWRGSTRIRPGGDASSTTLGRAGGES